MHRAVSFEACGQWLLLMCKLLPHHSHLLYRSACFWQTSIIINGHFESTGTVWIFTQERGEQTRVPGEKPRQPVWNWYRMEVKIHCPNQGLKPQPLQLVIHIYINNSVWSACAGSNQLSYWVLCASTLACIITKNKPQLKHLHNASWSRRSKFQFLFVASVFKR